MIVAWIHREGAELFLKVVLIQWSDASLSVRLVSSLERRIRVFTYGIELFTVWQYFLLWIFVGFNFLWMHGLELAPNCAIRLTSRACNALKTINLLVKQVIVIPNGLWSGPTHRVPFISVSRPASHRHIRELASSHIWLRLQARRSLGGYPWQQWSFTPVLSESYLHLDHVLHKYPLVSILEHFSLLQMVIEVLSMQLASFDHLWLDVDNPLHNFLIFSVDSLGLPLFAHVVQRLRRSPLHFEILLVDSAVFPFWNDQ